MSIDALFDTTFGCNIEYNNDMEMFPMYVVEYNILTKNNINNPWINSITFNSSIAATSLDEIIMKLHTLSHIGFDLKHKIYGVDINVIGDDMILRYKKVNDDSYSVSIDSYRYSSDNLRSFYLTTDSWKHNSCDGNVINSLSLLNFDRICADNHIEFAEILIQNESIYSVPLFSFLSSFISDINHWEIFNNNGVAINTHGNNNITVNIDADSTVFTSPRDCWLFQTKLPSYLKFYSKYINKIVFSIPFVIIFPSNQFSIVFTLSDSKYFVAIMIECKSMDKIVQCEPKFYPNINHGDLGRMNPMYQSKYFPYWNWGYNLTNPNMTFNLNQTVYIKCIIHNDPIISHRILYELSITNGNKKQYSAYYNRIPHSGSFYGDRTLYFSVGHFNNNSKLKYQIGSISIMKNDISASIAANIFSNNTNQDINSDMWKVEMLADCFNCVNINNSQIIVEKLDQTLTLKWSYPTNVYFLIDHKSSIITAINADLSFNSVWIFTNGNQYILFTIGEQLGFSFYPSPTTNVGHVNIHDDIFNNKEALRRIISNVYSHNIDANSRYNASDLLHIECINDPINDFFKIIIKHSNIVVTAEYSEAFETFTGLYLYFIAYSSQDTYVIKSISYEQQQIPHIEFQATISKKDDFLKQFSLTQERIPTLQTALFTNTISLQTKHINDSNITLNYWQLSITASFDNCIDFNLFYY
eukprot:403829_1